jgi:hypothetical protein
MKSLALTSFLIASAAAILPEISIRKGDRHTNGATANFARGAMIERRSGGLVGTNPFDVLSWSSAGAYYVNGKSLRG